MTKKLINLAGDDIAFDLNDRGLAYGDGVFETMLIHQGKPVWWDEHWQRLLRGAAVLKIPAPNEVVVRKACEPMIANENACVLKIILTRGSGGRGYKIPDSQDPRIIVSTHPAPSNIPNGINLQWCDTRLSRQPLLAGVKHLNRLEQVLARSEWQDKNIFDGLMCDTENNVVCTTSANVFVKVEGQWLSPKIDQAGIAGIARAWVLKQWPQAREAHITCAQVEASDAIFICNAVRGILAVRQLEGRVLFADQDISDLQCMLAREQPVFAMEGYRGT